MTETIKSTPIPGVTTTQPVSDIDEAFNQLFAVSSSFPSHLLSAQNFVTYLVNCQVWFNNARVETKQFNEQQAKMMAMRDEKMKEMVEKKEAKNEGGMLAS